jgi:pyruvate formate lyase activating enzyme
MDSVPTLAFAKRLADLRRPVWIRFVVVPGLTDAPDDVARIAEFSAALGNVWHTRRRARTPATLTVDSR